MYHSLIHNHCSDQLQPDPFDSTKMLSDDCHEASWCCVGRFEGGNKQWLITEASKMLQGNTTSLELD